MVDELIEELVAPRLNLAALASLVLTNHRFARLLLDNKVGYFDYFPPLSYYYIHYIILYIICVFDYNLIISNNSIDSGERISWFSRRCSSSATKWMEVEGEVEEESQEDKDDDEEEEEEVVVVVVEEVGVGPSYPFSSLFPSLSDHCFH